MSNTGPLLQSFNFKHETRTYLSVLMHGQKESESFQGKDWQVVNSEINWVGNKNTLWVSLGSSYSREKLFFNENLPKIMTLKAKACKACKGKTIPVILGIVNDLVNKLTAIRNKNLIDTEAWIDERLKNLIIDSRAHQQKKQDECVSLSMETLLEERVLVCRHKALIAAALLRELVEKGILPFGRVRQFRDQIIHHHRVSGHTWVVYRDITTGDLWICDPRLHVVANVNKYFTALEAMYNRSTLCSMVERLDRQDLALPILAEFNKHQIPFTVKEIPSKSRVGYPGLQLCLTFNDEYKHLGSFYKALEKQGIWFNHLNHSVYIPLSENPALYQLDVEKLLRDAGIYQQFQTQVYLPPELQPESLLFTRRRVTMAIERQWEDFMQKHRQPRIR